MSLLSKYLPVLAIVLLLASCGGGSSNSSGVTGNWTATLTDTSGTSLFVFKIALNQATDNSVSGTNLTFTSGAPCFENVSSDTGTATVSGTTNQIVTTALQLTIVGAEPGESSFNTLVLSGSDKGSTISGTWTLQGPASGCTGFGNFTMTKT